MRRGTVSTALNELFHAAQCADRAAGVDGADLARMAGAPGLEQFERFGAAHFANGMRSGRRRSEERTRSESEATPSLPHRRGSGATQPAFDYITRFGGLRNSKHTQPKMPARRTSRYEMDGDTSRVEFGLRR